MITSIASLMLIASGSVALGAAIGLRGCVCSCALVFAAVGSWVLT